MQLGANGMAQLTDNYGFLSDIGIYPSKGSYQDRDAETRGMVQ